MSIITSKLSAGLAALVLSSAALVTAAPASAKPIWEEYADSIGAPKGDYSKVGKCDQKDGKRWKRCVGYLSMAGTPAQREYARREMRDQKAAKRRGCPYDREAGEQVCVSGSGPRW